MRLSMLRPLYEQPAHPETSGWASVHLDASRNSEDAADALQARWRAARESLSEAGCDTATLDALGDAVLGHEPEPGRYGFAAFATGGSVALSRTLNGPPRRDIAAWGPLPHVMPLVAQLGEEIPYVRVVVDHTGAEVTSAGAGRLAHTETVEGAETFPLRKVKLGGWRQAHWQQAAQETWRRNAGTVADAVAELADRCDAEIVVVGGDPQSRPLLVQQLPERWRARVVLADTGTRAAGADLAHLDDVTVQAVAEQAAAHTHDVVSRYRMQRGRDAAAGDGLPAVVTALQRGQVDTVLLVDDPSSTEELWVGPGPLELSYDQAELRAMNVQQPVRARADAALVRTLACTDAALTLVGADELDAAGGVAALLRYADAGTRHR